RNSRPGQKADGVAEMPMERCKSAAEKFPPPGCRGQIGEKQYFSNHQLRISRLVVLHFPSKYRYGGNLYESIL
ncbi:hypothetical protein, partial [Faecalibacterium prausnitzii]